MQNHPLNVALVESATRRKARPSAGPFAFPSPTARARAPITINPVGWVLPGVAKRGKAAAGVLGCVGLEIG